MTQQDRRDFNVHERILIAFGRRADAKAAWHRRHARDLDPRTGRASGDHGSATDAIDYALDHEPDGDAATFLDRWRHGDLLEWPEFYAWLRGREAERIAPQTSEPA